MPAQLLAGFPVVLSQSKDAPPGAQLFVRKLLSYSTAERTNLKCAERGAPLTAAMIDTLPAAPYVGDLCCLLALLFKHAFPFEV